MKKILKISIIILLVIGVIAGTCYLFFINMKKEEDPIILVNYTNSTAKKTFDADLTNLNAKLIVTKGDTRLDWLSKTNAKLDSMMKTLTVYVVEDGGKISDNSIIRAIEEVESSRSYAQIMIDEYEVKIDHQSGSLGFNDLYEQLCVYLADYAELTKALNSYVVGLGVNKNSDIKYNMINLYSNIAINTFTSVKVIDGQASIVQDTTNMDAINGLVSVNNHYIGIPTIMFGSDANNFNKYYSKCDKVSFANNFAGNINTIFSINSDSTDEQRATFYLNKLYLRVGA